MRARENEKHATVGGRDRGRQVIMVVDIMYKNSDQSPKISNGIEPCIPLGKNDKDSGTKKKTGI